MRLSLIVAVAALTFGCGRSDLVNDDFFPSGGTDASGSTPDGGGDLDATNQDATSPGHPGHPTSDSGVDDGTTVGVPDARSGPGSCTTFSCSDGCCQADGTCFRYTPDPSGVIPQDLPCGSNGEACVTCATGDSCIGGACQRDLGETCTPANCAGCCFAAAVNGVTSTQCFEGSQGNSCGKGGAGCQRCTPSSNGGHCVADPAGGGDCEGVGLCNATNCAGCCSGDLCVVGTQDVGCGSGGTACQNCTSGGGFCIGIDPAGRGVEQGCGYDCSTAAPVCNTFCPTASTCAPTSDFFSNGP